MLRVYQYQEHCNDHRKHEEDRNGFLLPTFGDYVIQKKDNHGFWRNASNPYASKADAEQDMNNEALRH